MNITESFLPEHTLRLSGLLKKYIPLLRAEAGWWSAYIDYSEENIGQLQFALHELVDLFPNPNPSFIDFGSGDGVVAMLASLAGFGQVTGVELNSRLVMYARQIAQDLSLDDKITFFNNTYYDQHIAQHYISQAAADFERRHVLESIEGCELHEFLEELLASSGNTTEEIIWNYLFPSYGIPAGMQRYIAIPQDMSFIYPSDICFETIFLPQLRQKINCGQFLAVLGTESDTYETLNGFEKEVEINFQANEVGMILGVFKPA